MIRIRRFEEKCVELYTRRRSADFCTSMTARRLSPSASFRCWEAGLVVATYREHGHALARGVPMSRLWPKCTAKFGLRLGRGGSMHLFSARAVLRRVRNCRRRTAGCRRLGPRRQDAWQEIVTACFFGDGAAAEGEFHETMNLAALWKLPVLFVCENNLYAMGTRSRSPNRKRTSI